MMHAPVAPSLLAWYDRTKADLPWRSTRDPYRIWLSEIMLQQTQIETVIPYYMRFLEAYPQVMDLAAASLDSVLKLWEGLGYYSRARNLHRTAQIVASEHGGQFPDTMEGLRSLPGIGPYTAGAIGSIAFDLPVPVLDGNVIRVFSRLHDIAHDVTQRSTQTQLWQIAEGYVPAQRPGDYNQALMELGQKICTPRQPDCPACPLVSQCRAYAAGTQQQRPVKRKAAPTPHYDVAAGLVYDERGRLLIAQRPEEGLLGGLWEFPGGKQEAGESMAECLKRELNEELAIEVEVGALFVKVKHAFTHFKITLHALECRYLGPMPPYTAPQCLGVQRYEWVTLDELAQYSFGKADRQVIDALHMRRNMLL